MTARDIVMGAAGAASVDKTYIEDVFSTYLYTGNGSTQTITNGIDLAGKGGMVWIKERNNNTWRHNIFDTARGVLSTLDSSLSNAEYNSGYITSFNSTGFTLPYAAGTNNNSATTYASWTFRKAPKFFDVVTYTGNFVNGRQISHSLGQAPGMIIVKRTNANSNWMVYHRSLGATKYSILQSSGASGTDSAYWNDTEPTANSFTVGLDAAVNGNGSTYVAYLFAHDTTTDGLIQCGSFTADASGNFAEVNLGWEPQYLLFKPIDNVSDWLILDTMRGFSVDNGSYSGDTTLSANSGAAEVSSYYIDLTARGFKGVSGGVVNSKTYIYMAIRRGPMRTPTDGTKVFAPNYRSAGDVGNQDQNIGFAPDLLVSKCNKNASGSEGFQDPVWQDRLRGFPTNSGSNPTSASLYLSSASTGAESTTAFVGGSYNTIGPYQNVVTVTDFYTTGAGQTWIDWCFKRAPGFFDVVCYTGTGVARTVNHNLGVAPELMIVKSRSQTYPWETYSSTYGITDYLRLNTTDAINQGTSGFWGSSNPTATQFSLGVFANNNGSGTSYVAYLFASCPGVSKVGSYTGNGSSQTINCGFASGARFVLIKRTDSTGDWYVWDTARGIVAATDPHLSLNTTAAEVTTDDTIDPVSTGFIVNQDVATNVNVNAATYIYLAIA